MREQLSRLWACLVRPQAGFAALAAEGPRLRQSLGRLMLLRLPLALAHAWIAGKALLLTWTQLKDTDGEAWRQVMAQMPGALSLEEVRATLDALPPGPGWERCWPWLPLIVPVGLLGLWLHDAAWDHAGLWLLRGLKKEKEGRVRATLGAEAEALSVGSVGVAAALLGFLPYAGPVFTVIGIPLGLYLWCLRGVALAAFHGCPIWKGVVATLLHVVLFGLFACAMLALTWLLAMAIAGSLSASVS